MRVLITGGTGSLGRALTRRLLNDGVDRVIIMSRDEVKQAELVSDFGDHLALRMRLGDVRDCDRLAEVMWPSNRIDVVIHAAALKRVDSVSHEPGEVIKTNITGTMNVIRAAAMAGIPKVMVVSSDKAVNSTNVYGATKFVAELAAISMNSRVSMGTRISVVRYGNVMGSRGSVIPVWRQAIAEERPLEVTDPAMSRFILTLPQAVEFVLSSVDRMRGGEIFVPSIPSARLGDILESIKPDPDYPTTVVGLRPGGEKMHERLLSEEEVSRTVWDMDRYIVIPSHDTWGHVQWPGDLVLPFTYTSDQNGEWLSQADLAKLWMDL